MGADSTAIILPPRRRAPAFHWAGIMPLRDGVARAGREGRRGPDRVILLPHPRASRSVP